MSNETGGARPETFKLIGEDYTLAQALRVMLDNNPHVVMAGYSAPHPTEGFISLEIKTTGAITAKQALKQAAVELKQVCEHMKLKFQQQIDRFEHS